VPRPSAYQEALAWLYGTQVFGIKLGLENVQRLFRALNLFQSSRSGAFPSAEDLAVPKSFGTETRKAGDSEIAAPWQRHRPWYPKIIHVAGTNGKGSVCAMLDSILRAQGYSTGLFTSPHLVTFRERIQINGEQISEDEVANGLNTLRALMANWDPHPTFFEIVTALGLFHFREHRVDFVVLETGMGGRLDATNATRPIVSVLTPIDLDHQKWLGNTLPKIAAEKAGIINSKTPVVSAVQLSPAEEVIRARAQQCDAPLLFVRQSYPGEVALAGSHQKQNAALAIAALRAAEIAVDEDSIARGLACVRWPARFQHWNERIVIDGAHNPAGARVLAETWRQAFAHERATILLAVLQDKDVAGIVRALSPIAHRFVLPKIRSARALLPDELALLASNITPSLPCSIAPSIADALDLARTTPHRILLTGSLHFAGEALAHLQGIPAGYEECSQ
jgi:dihydrofolate synthase / folylpolyglutamate synthase